MRTSFINRIVSVMTGNNRHYRVKAQIAIKLADASIETSPDTLREAVLQVTKRNPWYDTLPPCMWDSALDLRGTSPVRSDVGVSEGIRQDNYWSTPETDWWFNLHPCRDDLEQGQLRAFEKYMEKIAEELASMKLANVQEVRYVATTLRMKSFKSK